MNTEFTPKQLENWRTYEHVRKGGKYNMFDPRARRSTGLSGEDYAFVMKFFSELKEANQSSEAK